MSVRPYRLLRGASLGAGLGTAFAASLCCVGPLAAGVLGLGGVGAFIALHPYRQHLSIATVLLLLTSVRLTYARRTSSCCSTSGEATDGAIDARERRWRRASWAIVVLAAALLTAPSWLALLGAS